MPSLSTRFRLYILLTPLAISNHSPSSCCNSSTSTALPRRSAKVSTSASIAMLPDPSGILVISRNNWVLSGCKAGHCRRRWFTSSRATRSHNGHCPRDLFNPLSRTSSLFNMNTWHISFAIISHCRIITERSLDLIWQRVPDFGTYVVEGLYTIWTNLSLWIAEAERLPRSDHGSAVDPWQTCGWPLPPFYHRSAMCLPWCVVRMW